MEVMSKRTESMSSDIYFDFSIQCMKYLITESMFILQRDIINRAQRKDYLSQKPSSSRVLRSVPPSLTLLSVICWVPFWVVSSPFFSTNTRKSPSRETWRETVVYLKKSKSPHLAGFLPHGFLHELVLLLQPAWPV